MAKAHVEPYNGSPAIVVDGKPCPPMTITLLGRDNGSPGRQAYYRRLGEAVSLLKSADLLTGRVYVRGDDGSYREASVNDLSR